jgi:hypothetical protein
MGHEWEQRGVHTNITSDDSLIIDQWRVRHKYVKLANSEWQRFFAIVLQYAKHQGPLPNEIRKHAKGKAPKKPTESDISDLFITRPPEIRRGSRVDAPILEGMPGERVYSAYMIGSSLCLGINPSDRWASEPLPHAKPDIFIVRGGRALEHTRWLGFKPDDIPHLMKGIAEHYPALEIRAIVKYFLKNYT